MNVLTPQAKAALDSLREMIAFKRAYIELHTNEDGDYDDETVTDYTYEIAALAEDLADALADLAGRSSENKP